MAKKPSKYKKRTQKKEESKLQNKARREKHRKRQRNKKIINYSVIVIIVLALGYGVFQAIKPEGPGPHDALAECLTESGVIMYGTDWCPHCQNQKQLFDKSFKYVNYINCDLNPAACDLAGVEGYPTWTFPDTPPVSGTQDLKVLAERAGCEA